MVFRKKIKEADKKVDVESDQSYASDELKRHLDLLRDVLENTQANIKKALGLLKEKNVDTQALLASLENTKVASAGFLQDQQGTSRVVEGVFNGEKMVGGDGLEYNVPANYASKSKLIEGDILKLTISGNGSFIYKQIGPVERQQLITTLSQDETSGDWYALREDNRWRLLTASVTYFHGASGDEVVIIVPRDSKSRWAAVENIIKGR